MRVLVVGSGGREHALCWSIAASPLLTKLWCAPGQPRHRRAWPTCVPIGVMDIAALVAFARDNAIDLVVPGPEAPLVAGITDAMEAAGIPAAGRPQAAAQLEGSKTFAKEICDAAGIPTARWERFDDAEAAREFVRRRGAPIVVKADGLAAGKGVVVAATEAEAAGRDRRHHGRPHLRRGRRRRGDRGMPDRRRGLALRAVRRRRTRCCSARRRTTSGSATAIPAPTPAAWAAYAPTPMFPAGAGTRGDGAHHPPGAGRDGAPRHAVPRHPVRRPDADRRTGRS